YMRAYPDTDVRERIDIPGQQIWFVLIHGRCPVNGHPTQDEAQKNRHVQPVAAPHQDMVPADYKHAGLTLRRARSDPFLMELRGTWHRHSPHYFREVMPLGGAGAKCARPSSISQRSASRTATKKKLIGITGMIVPSGPLTLRTVRSASTTATSGLRKRIR